MLYVGVVLTILQGILINVPMTWTSVIDEYGTCNVYSLWSNSVSPQIYATFILAWLYITPLTVLGYLYGRIVVTLNRKRSVVAPEQSSSSTTQHTTQDESMSRSQMNVIKTMILISVGYALSTFLSCFGYVSFAYDPSSVLFSEPVYYSAGVVDWLRVQHTAGVQYSAMPE